MALSGHHKSTQRRQLVAGFWLLRLFLISAVWPPLSPASSLLAACLRDFITKMRCCLLIRSAPWSTNLSRFHSESSNFGAFSARGVLFPLAGATTSMFESSDKLRKFRRSIGSASEGGKLRRPVRRPASTGAGHRVLARVSDRLAQGPCRVQRDNWGLATCPLRVSVQAKGRGALGARFYRAPATLGISASWRRAE
jgi:hypothetical protein